MLNFGCRITDANVSVDVDLSMFVERNCEFYTYFGSLTTPPCHESVRWIIFREKLIVTETAVQKHTHSSRVLLSDILKISVVITPFLSVR